MADSRTERVRELARSLGVRAVDDLLQVVEKEAEILAASGELDLGPAHAAGGKVLEFSVKQAFRSGGFQVVDGPPGEHDALVQPPPNARWKMPVVLEIKSSKLPSPARGDLRQLDDWVFGLSGEARIRRRGTMSIDEFGPRLTRHKGVMVFNGPVGTPFNQRAPNWLGGNEVAFAELHFLCVARLDHVLAWCGRAQGDEAQRLQFWEAMYGTGGALAPPS